jgi:hypothetical protein
MMLFTMFYYVSKSISFFIIITIGPPHGKRTQLRETEDRDRYGRRGDYLQAEEKLHEGTSALIQIE